MKRQASSHSTWKDIRQAVNPRARSRQARRRRRIFFLRMAGIVLLSGATGWGIFAGVRYLQAESFRLPRTVESVPLRDIEVTTDGVLSQGWVIRTLAIDPGAGLMDLDLSALQARLIAYGQIRSAVLSRQFPDVLSVGLQERLPVLRVLVQEPGERLQMMLVAHDGAVYRGVGYDRHFLGSLPYLDGVTLRGTPEGFAPVAGMDVVTELVNAAQLQAPHLYRSWRVVSLVRLESFGEIVVKTRDIPEIVFNRRDDFSRQLARLDYIIDYARHQRVGSLDRVDLSLGLQVAVEVARGRHEF